METSENKEEKKEGLFVSSLKRTAKDIKADRAEAIGEQAELKMKRQVEDIGVILKEYKRELSNMLDMSPNNALSLEPAKNFDADKFAERRLELGRKVRLTEIDLKIASDDYKLLFGKEI